MIYVTGDTHGDFTRLQERAVKRLKREDLLIICGDFGFVWDGSAAEQRLLQKIGKMRCTILFLDGTHDNLPLIQSYPQEAWSGGLVHRISGNLLHAVRGCVYTVQGHTLFTLGGGVSDDLDQRVEGESWWPQELPSQEELAFAAQNLAAHDHRVDYIFTHQPSADVGAFLTGSHPTLTPMDLFLNALPQTCAFTHWYFGQLHRDKSIPPRHTAVFRQVLALPQ